jgi:tryptophanyl-tRNA synthetase
MAGHSKKRVFSGVQPSGKLHLGNYLGALSQWVRMQDEYDCVYCVVDLHAITIPEALSPKDLHEKTREVAALYIACGIDPQKSAIFVQSHVKEHAELAWILGCMTPLGWLERMTQYKAKAGLQESVGTGLLVYPALMAADILLYDTGMVPVGEDQKQHIEITRDVAMRVNHMFGEVFVVPEAMIPKSGARVMGFDDPENKMSKSTGEKKAGHSVGLLDDPKQIKKTVMSAVTDSGQETRFDHAGAGVLNLLTVYQAITGKDTETIEAEFAGGGYGNLKKAVAEAVLAAVEPVQARYNEIVGDPATIEQILKDGADRVRPIAAATLDRVKKAMGIG